MNRVVARFADGRMIKGHTTDFMPGRDSFHITPENPTNGGKTVVILTRDLKALFFVKDFKGNPDRKDSNSFDPTRPMTGRKIRVLFKDSELLVGTTQGYQQARPGFFLVPADAASNIERAFIIAAATRQVAFM